MEATRHKGGRKQKETLAEDHRHVELDSNKLRAAHQGPRLADRHRGAHGSRGSASQDAEQAQLAAGVAARRPLLPSTVARPTETTPPAADLTQETQKLEAALRGKRRSTRSSP